MHNACCTLFVQYTISSSPQPPATPLNDCTFAHLHYAQMHKCTFAQCTTVHLHLCTRCTLHTFSAIHYFFLSSAPATPLNNCTFTQCTMHNSTFAQCTNVQLHNCTMHICRMHKCTNAQCTLHICCVIHYSFLALRFYAVQCNKMEHNATMCSRN